MLIIQPQPSKQKMSHAREYVVCVYICKCMCVCVAMGIPVCVCVCVSVGVYSFFLSTPHAGTITRDDSNTSSYPTVADIIFFLSHRIFALVGQ